MTSLQTLENSQLDGVNSTSTSQLYYIITV